MLLFTMLCVSRYANCQKTKYQYNYFYTQNLSNNPVAYSRWNNKWFILYPGTTCTMYASMYP